MNNFPFNELNALIKLHEELFVENPSDFANNLSLQSLLIHRERLLEAKHIESLESTPVKDRRRAFRRARRIVQNFNISAPASANP